MTHAVLRLPPIFRRVPLTNLRRCDKGVKLGLFPRLAWMARLGGLPVLTQESAYPTVRPQRPAPSAGWLDGGNNSSGNHRNHSTGGNNSWH